LPKASTVKRRSFIKYFLLFMGSAFAMMLTWGTAKFALMMRVRTQRREISSEILSKLQPDIPLHTPEAGAWLWQQTPSADIEALDDRCSHLGCRAKWNPNRRLFECPCHGSEFDPEGKVIRGPATRPMARLAVIKDGTGKIFLKEKAS
jgi:nitrite reductase/ring-hydroxylating ferredoxin subunit